MQVTPLAFSQIVQVGIESLVYSRQQRSFVHLSQGTYLGHGDGALPLLTAFTLIYHLEALRELD